MHGSSGAAGTMGAPYRAVEHATERQRALPIRPIVRTYLERSRDTSYIVQPRPIHLRTTNAPIILLYIQLYSPSINLSVKLQRIHRLVKSGTKLSFRGYLTASHYCNLPNNQKALPVADGLLVWLLVESCRTWLPPSVTPNADTEYL